MGESGKEALSTLMDLSGQWIDTVRQLKPICQIILDLDSSVSETYGQQEGSAYNGYFGYECYHPLFCFNQFGDVERAMLRNGERTWGRPRGPAPICPKHSDEGPFGRNSGPAEGRWSPKGSQVATRTVDRPPR